jgi:fatty-acyl-CoA synthase
MGGFAPSGAPSSKPARALGKAVVGPLLATAARRFRDREAFFCAGTGRRLSFGQTNERCNRLAHGLAGLRLEKTDTIAFLCKIAPKCRRSIMRSQRLDSSAFP